MQAIYWVLSRDCNQRCPHCYNNSEPGAAGLSLTEATQCLNSLPEQGEIPIESIILSGGEVLVWPELLFHVLVGLQDRYDNSVKRIVQTNGDLLDEATLDSLLAHNVVRMSVSSMDKYHPKSTLQRRDYLQRLFESRGMVESNDDGGPDEQGFDRSEPGLMYSFWGAVEGSWIGPLWPRGRAMQKKLTKATSDDRFCAKWSGAKGFLNYHDPSCEVNVQLADVYPCCPMTCRPIGSLLEESLLSMLDRCAKHPVYRALNEGRPEAMGEYLGISEEEGFRRSTELGNHCLWCDEFFTKHAPDLLHAGARTERGEADLILKLNRIDAER